MTVGMSGVCFIIAVILFVLSAWPAAEGYRLERVGLAFLAAGHLL